MFGDCVGEFGLGWLYVVVVVDEFVIVGFWVVL